MGSPLVRLNQGFFTVLAVVVIGLPLYGVLTSDSTRWGTVPEWIGACGLLLVAAGVWKIARTLERSKTDA